MSTPATYRMRGVNPAPIRIRGGRRRGMSLKTMLGLGSQILQRLTQTYPWLDAQSLWEAMEIAWDDGTLADQRTALTRLQVALQAWTAEDANIAGDLVVQKYRKQLHSVLDHE